MDLRRTDRHRHTYLRWISISFVALAFAGDGAIERQPRYLIFDDDMLQPVAEESHRYIHCKCYGNPQSLGNQIRQCVAKKAGTMTV